MLATAGGWTYATSRFVANGMQWAGSAASGAMFQASSAVSAAVFAIQLKASISTKRGGAVFRTRRRKNAATTIGDDLKKKTSAAVERPAAALDDGTDLTSKAAYASTDTPCNQQAQSTMPPKIPDDAADAGSADSDGDSDLDL